MLAVFLRKTILERLREPETIWQPQLAKCAEEYKQHYHGEPSERLSIRFSDNTHTSIQHAADVVSKGNISALIIAILYDRYYR